MVLLAKRVRANRELVKMASTSSADEKRRMRSKIPAACSRVSNFLLSLYLCLWGTNFAELAYFVCRAHPNISKPRRTRAMPRAYYLLWLPLAAVWSAPQSPLLARANRVHRIPKLRRDPGIRRIFQHPHSLAVLDLPSNLASELKVVALVVNRPRFIGLHINAIIGRCNELFQTQRRLAGKNADIGHANHRQPVPAFGA